MNKQGPGKIDWTDWTWNPISGCRHGCEYCYMRRMEKRFPGIMEPMFHPARLREPVHKKPSKIFVGSSGDMWGEWVPSLWIKEVLNMCEKTDLTYQFLTKNPDRYGDFVPLHNAWYGTTVDGTARTEDNISRLVFRDDRSGIKNRFVSFEPLLMPVVPDLSGIRWVIIGADSTPGAQRPPREWADIIIREARSAGIPVWVKDNYGYPDVIKEMPGGMN